MELGNVDPNETKLTWFTHDSSRKVVQQKGKPPMILFGETAVRILAKPRAQVHSEVQLFQLYMSSLYMSKKAASLCIDLSHAGIRIRKVLILLALWGAPQGWETNDFRAQSMDRSIPICKAWAHPAVGSSM